MLFSEENGFTFSFQTPLLEQSIHMPAVQAPEYFMIYILGDMLGLIQHIDADRDNMAAIMQTAFSSASIWMKTFETYMSLVV